MNESDNNEIDVRVLFFGGARDVVGDSLVLSLKAPPNCRRKERLLERHPALNDSGARCYLP